MFLQCEARKFKSTINQECDRIIPFVAFVNMLILTSILIIPFSIEMYDFGFCCKMVITGYILTNKEKILETGGMVLQCLCLTAQISWVRFLDGSGPFCVDCVLPVSAWVPSGCSSFLPHFKDKQGRL